MRHPSGSKRYSSFFGYNNLTPAESINRQLKTWIHDLNDIRINYFEPSILLSVEIITGTSILKFQIHLRSVVHQRRRPFIPSLNFQITKFSNHPWSLHSIIKLSNHQISKSAFNGLWSAVRGSSKAAPLHSIFKFSNYQIFKSSVVIAFHYQITKSPNFQISFQRSVVFCPRSLHSIFKSSNHLIFK